MRILPIASRVFNAQNLKTVNIRPSFFQMGADTVSFGNRRPDIKDVNVDHDTAKFVANSLSTSTSGHRAEYNSKTFNPEVVKLMTLGVADYAKNVAKKEGHDPFVIVGGDARVATKESLPLIRETLLNQGINVFYIEDPVPTPLLALTAEENDVDIAVLMTASHNPWTDGGYNLVTKEAAIAPVDVTLQVAKGIEKYAKMGTYVEKHPSDVIDFTFYPYNSYKSAIEKTGLIDWGNIRESGVNIYYDGLKGAGTYVMPRLLEDYDVNYTEIVSGDQVGPNPTKDNLGKLSAAVAQDDSRLKIGISNDGDADRFGVIDENGKFVSPNDVLLLTAYHLAKNKGRTGAIIRSQATSKQVDEIAKLYDLPLIETPVGFKYIGEDILDLRKEGEDILVAGEESGGLTVNGHIPEKDGILATLLMADLVATESKPISQILKKVKADLPNTYVQANFSKKLTSEEQKNVIMNRVENIFNDAMNGKVEFGELHDIDPDKSAFTKAMMMNYKKGGDGVKLVLTDGSTILVRKSGTEPLVKCYIEASGKNEADAKFNAKVLRDCMDEIFVI